MHEYEYSENKCTRVWVLYNVLEYEYDYIRMPHDYIECSHDYFNEYPVSNIKAIFMESLGVTRFQLLCQSVAV